MAGEGGDGADELSMARKLRLLAYGIGAVGVLAAVGLLGFQIISP